MTRKLFDQMQTWVDDQPSSLEMQIIEAKAKEIQDEMDRYLLWSTLQDHGWAWVHLSKLTDNNHAVDITYWLADNCKEAYERVGCEFLFQSSKDAQWFMLRWGTE